MGGVEGIVRTLQLFGYHERGVRHGHRHDARRQPPRGRDGGEERTERHAAERREQERGALPRQAAAVGPGEREQGQDEERPRRAGRMGIPNEPAEGERREHRHGTEREV